MEKRSITEWERKKGDGRMLGLLIVATKVICEAVNGVREIADNKERKANSTLYDGTVYIDGKGRERWYENNRQVYIGRDMIGDFVIKDIQSGYVYRNITEEKSKKDIQEELENYEKNGNTTICLGLDKNYEYNLQGIPKGARFKDIKTGEIYVIRELEGQYYYVNPKTNMLVRRTDWGEYLGQYKGEVQIGRRRLTIEEFNNSDDKNFFRPRWYSGIEWSEVMYHRGKFRKSK